MQDPKRLCVLFAGTMGHGKDTAADMLSVAVEEKGATSLRMAFADPIKDIVVHLLGIPKSVSYGTQQDKLDFEVYGRSARHWLQWVGTDMARDQIHKDIWVHRFAERSLASDAQVVIGSDCRFHNEMVTMRQLLEPKMGLVIIKVVNPRVPVNLTHQSESEIYNTPDAEFDIVIRNSGELTDLRADITNIAENILTRIP